MSTRPDLSALPRLVSEMESHIQDVTRWGAFLGTLACGRTTIEVDHLSVVADAITQLGDRLRQQFQAAHAVAYPKEPSIGREEGEDRR